MSQQFIAQPISPSGGKWFDPPAIGEPSLPTAFLWNTKTMDVTRVIKSWKRFGQDRTHGSGETYVHKHFYEVETPLGIATIYFERQPRMRNQAERWILYTLEESDGS